MYLRTFTTFFFFILLLSFALFTSEEARAAGNIGVGGVCTKEVKDGDECLSRLECKTIYNAVLQCIRPAKQNHGTGRTGEPCATDTDCASVKCSGSTTYVCLEAIKDSVPMGFACDNSTECKIGASQVMPLCDESKDPIDGGKICKGNASDTGCNPDPENWCVFGITCNEQTNTCTNDFGAASTRKLRLGEDTTDIKIQINRVINILLSFLAIIGVILIVYAGILWATAGGNDEQVGKAKKTMIAAAIGLIIIGVAWTIISFVLSLGDTLS